MKNMKLIHTWEYKTLDGETIGLVDRLEPIAQDKKIKQSKKIIPRFVIDHQGYFKSGMPLEFKDSKPLFGLETFKLSDDIYIVEGEKCATALSSLGYTCITSLGGSNAAELADWSIFEDIKGRNIVLLKDNDQPGLDYMEKVYKSLKEVNSELNITLSTIHDDRPSSDFCNWAGYWSAIFAGTEWDGYEDLAELLSEENIHNMKESFIYQIKNNKEEVPKEWNIITGSKGLNCISFYDFVKLDISSPKVYLSPWLTEQSLTMVFAPRGVGKTFFSLNCAYALSSGKGYLKYEVASPVPVLYIDGEMQAPLMIDRLKGIANDDIKSLPIQIITPDLQKNRAMPDLSTTEGQAEVDEMIEKFDPKVIFVDNLSTLCRTGKENDSESWNSVQVWAIKHRSQGRSIVFVHHANKDGGQRGSSKKEDILDNVILLQRPEDYDESIDGAKFEIIFKKNRSLFGKDTATILACLGSNNQWSWDYVQTNEDKALEMLKSGMKQVEIAKELDLSPATISKMINRAKQKQRST